MKSAKESDETEQAVQSTSANTRATGMSSGVHAAKEGEEKEEIEVEAAVETILLL